MGASLFLITGVSWREHLPSISCTLEQSCAGRGEHPHQAGITATVNHWLWKRSDGTLKQSMDAVLDPLRMGNELPPEMNHAGEQRLSLHHTLQ